MDSTQIRPLKTLTVKQRPITTQALAWSCDAELAVATDDTIHVFLPEYPKVDGGGGEPADTDDVIHHQFSTSIQAQGIFRPNSAVNAQLCAFAGVRLPPREAEDNIEEPRVVAGRDITGYGASVCQVVRLEWSPNSLGVNRRPVLTAMLTTGILLTLGEDIDIHSTVASGLRSRNLKQWKILWGLGSGLPIPAEHHEGSYRLMDDRAKSFSWAQEIMPGRALLAYATDEDEVVIMSVQYFLRAPKESPDDEPEAIWQIREVDRFDTSGPHHVPDSMDPDYVPGGSAFSLKWSPWAISEDYRTATISYLARNYVGFRRIRIDGDWQSGEQPRVHIDESDSTGICLHMALDAFIEWENMVWREQDARVARGVICTPFLVKPFQVDLDADAKPPMMTHPTSACNTIYPETSLANPIAGLVIHQPDKNNKPKMPIYSLVRISATPTNHDWYEHNATGGRSTIHIPQWAERIQRDLSRLIPREFAPETAQSDSDSSLSGEEVEEEEEYYNRRDEQDGKGQQQSRPPRPQISPYRFRFWAMAASPGGTSTVVLVSRHSIHYPDRRGNSKLMFEWKPRSEKKRNTKLSSPGINNNTNNNTLTTEGHIWEWMYNAGPHLPGVTTHSTIEPLLTQTATSSALCEFFKDIRATQICVFCDEKLVNNGAEAKCSNNHSFATCTLTGLVIMSPGVSHICAVCQRRCLKRSELVKFAREHIGTEVDVPPSAELCGGCGGKFVA